MNINRLRRNYDNLTLLQRLALADNALGRDDENEALAIKDASPRISFTQPDFCPLYDEILRVRVFNLIERLNYIMNFDYLMIRQLEKLIDKSSLKMKRIDDDLKLAAFLYVRATDSWRAVNEELGLRPNFDYEVFGHLFAIDVIKSKDDSLRKVAFSEDEAKAFVKKETGSDEFRTLEAEIEAYRKALDLDSY
ncbi:MAG TPA: hypothetical protein PKD26_13255 [Pyrinomonadaceae bacterium]|nr:hypothetical protein [Pyrinomonadaceae bacterium]